MSRSTSRREQLSPALSRSRRRSGSPSSRPRGPVVCAAKGQVDGPLGEGHRDLDRAEVLRGEDQGHGLGAVRADHGGRRPGGRPANRPAGRPAVPVASTAATAVAVGGASRAAPAAVTGTGAGPLSLPPASCCGGAGPAPAAAAPLGWPRPGRVGVPLTGAAGTSPSRERPRRRPRSPMRQVPQQPAEGTGRAGCGASARVRRRCRCGRALDGQRGESVRGRRGAPPVAR